MNKNIFCRKNEYFEKTYKEILMDHISDIVEGGIIYEKDHGIKES